MEDAAAPSASEVSAVPAAESAAPPKVAEAAVPAQSAVPPSKVDAVSLVHAAPTPIEELETQPGTLPPAWAEPVGGTMEAPPDTVAPTVVEGTPSPAASPATPAAPEAPTPALPAPPAEPPAAPPAAPAPAAPQPPQARGVDAGSKRDQNSAALDGLAAQPPGRVLELRGLQALSDQHVAMQVQNKQVLEDHKIKWTTHKNEGMRLKRLMEESGEGKKFPHMQRMFSGTKEAT